jgi:hypothetical protein
MLERLVEADFPGKGELKSMLGEIKARTIDEDGSVELRSDIEGMARVVKRVPVEAEAKDSDGFTIHVLLHVVDGRPDELEIYKDDGSMIQCMPDPSAFEVTVLPPAPKHSRL